VAGKLAKNKGPLYVRANCVVMLRLALLVAVVGGANAGDGGGGGGLFTSTARYVRLYEVERSLAEVLQVSETVRRSVWG
jgi:hypothetical protein